MFNRLVTVHLLQLIISVRDRRLPGLAHRVQDLLGEEPGLEVGAGQQVAHHGTLHTQHILAHLTFKERLDGEKYYDKMTLNTDLCSIKKWDGHRLSAALHFSLTSAPSAMARPW